MSYSRKIAHLEETHAMIKRELIQADQTGQPDHVIFELKKKKLHVKDLIAELKEREGREFQ
jgi:hypothetical protein